MVIRSLVSIPVSNQRVNYWIAGKLATECAMVSWMLSQLFDLIRNRIRMPSG